MDYTDTQKIVLNRGWRFQISKWVVALVWGHAHQVRAGIDLTRHVLMQRQASETAWYNALSPFFRGVTMLVSGSRTAWYITVHLSSGSSNKARLRLGRPLGQSQAIVHEPKDDKFVASSALLQCADEGAYLYIWENDKKGQIRVINWTH